MLRAFLIFLFLISHIGILFYGEGCSKKKGRIIVPSTDYSLDPFFAKQWYLNAAISKGWDIHAGSVWESGNQGEGVIVGVLDEGMDLNHPDLQVNALPQMSWNFSTPAYQTDVKEGHGHGTAVMGVIAARDGNNMGTRGIASRASLVGFNVLNSSLQTDAVIVQGLNRSSNVVGVYNASFGPKDDTGEFDVMSTLIRTTLESALASGRSGKGSVYVWANGNGGRSNELSHYDGSVNFYGVIPVCATDQNGVKTNYSEFGSNIWICAPGGTTGYGMATTDKLGTDGINNGKQVDIDTKEKNYTMNFIGTSAATPVVTGVIALMEKVNPNLTWRDIKWILALSAREPAQSSRYILGYEDDFSLKNLAGLFYSSGYGFGIVDAEKAVALASHWVNVGPLSTMSLPNTQSKAINKNLCDSCFIKDTQSISAVSAGEVKRIEYLELEITITHENWGDLVIALAHDGKEGSTPDGQIVLKNQNEQTASVLAIPHKCYSINANQEYVEKETCDQPSSSGVYRFGISRHLGENPTGNWTLYVEDADSNNKTGQLISWRLKFIGE
jgi:kexin